EAVETAERPNPSLRDMSVAQILGNREREAHHLDAVERLARRAPFAARRDHPNLMTATHQMTVDVVHIDRIGVRRVRWIPVGGAEDAERSAHRPAPWPRGQLG